MQQTSWGWALVGLVATLWVTGCGAPVAADMAAPAPTATTSTPADDAGPAPTMNPTDPPPPAQDDAGDAGVAPTTQDDAGSTPDAQPDAGPVETGDAAPATADAGPQPDAGPAATTDAGSAPDAAPTPPVTYEAVLNQNADGSSWNGRMRNSGSAPLATGSLTLRFWFLHPAGCDGACMQQRYETDRGLEVAQISPGALPAFRTIESLGMTATTHADTVVELTFPQGAQGELSPTAPVTMAPGDIWPVSLQIQGLPFGGILTAWSTQAGDTNPQQNDEPVTHVTGYVAGALVWGTEPTPATDP